MRTPRVILDMHQACHDESIRAKEQRRRPEA